jgi:hypothetical protein
VNMLFSRYGVSIAVLTSIWISPVYAGFFGPSNFEECMSDGKIGRSTAEIFQLKKSCQKKFPKLPSIANGNNRPVQCIFQGSPDVYSIQFNKKDNTSSFNGKPNNVILFTDEILVISGGGKEPPTEINYLNGELKFISLYAKCSESVNK